MKEELIIQLKLNSDIILGKAVYAGIRVVRSRRCMRAFKRAAIGANHLRKCFNPSPEVSRVFTEIAKGTKAARVSRAADKMGRALAKLTKGQKIPSSQMLDNVANLKNSNTQFIAMYDKCAGTLASDLNKNALPIARKLQNAVSKLPESHGALALLAGAAIVGVLVHLKAKKDNTSHIEALKRGVGDIMDSVNAINKELVTFIEDSTDAALKSANSAIQEISELSEYLVASCYDSMAFLLDYHNSLEQRQDVNLKNSEKTREKTSKKIPLGEQQELIEAQTLRKKLLPKSLQEIDDEIEKEYRDEVSKSLAEIAELNPIVADGMAAQIGCDKLVNEHEKLQEDIVNTKSAIRDELTKLVKTGAISVLDPDHPINQIRERLNELDQDTPLPKQVEHLRGILELTKDMENYNGTNTPPNMPENVAELFAKYPVPNSGNNVKQTQAIQQFKQNVGEAINKLDDKPLLDAANKNENTKRVAAGLGIGQKPTNGNRNLPVVKTQTPQYR